MIVVKKWVKFRANCIMFIPDVYSGYRGVQMKWLVSIGVLLSGAVAFSPVRLSARTAAPTVELIVSPHRQKGRFTTVSAAIAAIPKNSKSPVTIVIRPGIYHEHLIIPRHLPPLTLRGTNARDTVLVYSLIAHDKGPDGRELGTFGTASVWVRANNFSAAHITFANDAGLSGNGYNGQALAIRVDGDKAIFYRCRFLGWQDTILLNKNRQYFDHCHILGAVDFIFGNATAFFNRCRITALGYGCITAARTPQNTPYGFVFSHCVVRSLAGNGHTWLGRPWGPYAAVAWLHCQMPAALNPARWMHWNDKKNPETARFIEYRDSGKGAGALPGWIGQLKPGSARAFSVGHVLSGSDGWNPRPAAKLLAGRN